MSRKIVDVVSCKHDYWGRIRLILDANSSLYYDVIDIDGANQYQCLKNNLYRYFNPTSTLEGVIYGKGTNFNINDYQ